MINNVNVIDLRALSPGMRHTGAQNNKMLSIQKKTTFSEYRTKSSKKHAKSPFAEQSFD